MSNLKKENVTKCFSLLREFIDAVDQQDSKKGIAVLALNQLQNITAGKGGSDDSDVPLPPELQPQLESTCTDKPRAY